jgi:hypothetical protein
MGGKGWAGLGLGGGRRGIVGGGVRGGGKDGGEGEVRLERKTGFCFYFLVCSSNSSRYNCNISRRVATTAKPHPQP